MVDTLGGVAHQVEEATGMETEVDTEAEEDMETEEDMEAHVAQTSAEDVPRRGAAGATTIAVISEGLWRAPRWLRHGLQPCSRRSRTTGTPRR